MPRHPSEFGSALPGVAELQPKIPAQKKEVTSRSREQTPQEKAQRMWDTYKDIKSAWVSFARESKSRRKKPDESDTAARIDLLDPDNPLAQDFHATPLFQKLHARLTKLWSDETVREAWRGEMKKNAGEWADVNGSWEKYQETHQEIGALEQEYDALQKERFAERGKPVRARRRTLTDDVVDFELALAEERAKADALFKKSPELAAKILASAFAERRRELRSPEGFMWFPSRRAIVEQVEKILTDKETLRLIVLEGEAGTGKTTLAGMLARHFTDAPALHVEVGEKTKADRALFADEKLETGSSPTIYKPILFALTGKERPTDSELNHDGRAVFIDEFNKLTNDEGGIVATILDRCRVGGKTGYHLLGANPDDVVQPKALVLAAQNPAGGRFRGRTDFTPEVKRKMEIVPVEYFPQTADNPELYEAFLVALQDQDGRIRAKKEEVGLSWKLTKDTEKNTRQDKLDIAPDKGGALWRLAQMLHQTYENLAHRPNALTRANPDAWIGGRVLPPGDIFKWLKEYQIEVKKGTSLEHFISQKLFRWLETSFQSAADAGDKQLYLDLAKQFGLVVEKSGEYNALPQKKITPDFLNERQAAELSPRVPRPIIDAGKLETKPSEFTKMVFDCTDAAGKKYKKVEARIEESPAVDRYVAAGTETPVYVVVGTIRECVKQPAWVGQIVLAEETRPEQKLVVATLNDFEKKEPERGAYEIVVQNALNPYREALLASGIPNIDQNPLSAERKEVAWDLVDTLKDNQETYKSMGLSAWAENIATANFADFTQEKRKIIEQEIAAGAIPVWMPDKATQLATMVEQFKKAFKPIWIKESKEQKVKDAYLEWDHFIKLINDKEPKLVDGVPDRPYVSMMRPTQKPDERTCNKIVNQQRLEFVAINSERAAAYQSPAHVINPHEYGALQTVHSRLSKALMSAPPIILNPIDSATWIRFINLPLSAGGNVPSAGFDPGGARAGFVGGGAGLPDAECGFRLAVRVKF